MKIILSPTKTMKQKEGYDVNSQYPLFLNEAEALVKKLKALDVDALKSLWNCSDNLVLENYNRIQNLDLYHHLTEAIDSYDGLVFKYLKNDLDDRDKTYLVNHVYILSALYGALRINDGITPYRLDMGDKLGDLYDYWSIKLLPLFKDEIIINLASLEYSCVLKPYIDTDYWLDIDFLTYNNHNLITKGTYAKMARGALTRFCAKENIENIEDIKAFKELDFYFNNDLSSDKHYVFVKKV